MHRFRPYFPAILVPAVISLLLVLCSGSIFVSKKVIGLLVMPVGLVWLCLIGIACLPGLTRLARVCLVVTVAMFSLAGSPYLGGSLIRSLQAPYQAFADGPAEPLDAVLVLGAGTMPTPGKRIGLSHAGDRVLFPVLLFKQGKIHNLVTSGRSVIETGPDRILSEETRGIWIDLGIPDERIFQLPEPRNTREEITAFHQFVKSKPEWTNVGVCTSAWHLPRALGIAQELGFDLVPVPADFRGRKPKFSTRNLIPQADAIDGLQTAVWEILGRATGA